MIYKWLMSTQKMLTIINYQAKTIWNHNEKPLQQPTMTKILSLTLPSVSRILMYCCWKYKNEKLLKQTAWQFLIAKYALPLKISSAMVHVLEFGHTGLTGAFHVPLFLTPPSRCNVCSINSVVVEIFTLRRSANTINQKSPLPLATQKAGY